MSADRALKEGSIAWVRYGDHPWWPAVLVQKKKDSVDKYWVNFFNDTEGAFVSLQKCKPFRKKSVGQFMVSKDHENYPGLMKAVHLAVEDLKARSNSEEEDDDLEDEETRGDKIKEEEEDGEDGDEPDSAEEDEDARYSDDDDEDYSDTAASKRKKNDKTKTRKGSRVADKKEEGKPSRKSLDRNGDTGEDADSLDDLSIPRKHGGSKPARETAKSEDRISRKAEGREVKTDADGRSDDDREVPGRSSKGSQGRNNADSDEEDDVDLDNLSFGGTSGRKPRVLDEDADDRTHDSEDEAKDMPKGNSTKMRKRRGNGKNDHRGKDHGEHEESADLVQKESKRRRHGPGRDEDKQSERRNKSLSGEAKSEEHEKDTSVPNPKLEEERTELNSRSESQAASLKTAREHSTSETRENDEGRDASNAANDDNNSGSAQRSKQSSEKEPGRTAEGKAGMDEVGVTFEVNLPVEPGEPDSMTIDKAEAMKEELEDGEFDDLVKKLRTAREKEEEKIDSAASALRTEVKDLEEQIASLVKKLKRKIDSLDQAENSRRNFWTEYSTTLEKISKAKVTVSQLKNSGVGKIVIKISRSGNRLAGAAKQLSKLWMEMVQPKSKDKSLSSSPAPAREIPTKKPAHEPMHDKTQSADEHDGETENAATEKENPRQVEDGSKTREVSPTRDNKKRKSEKKETADQPIPRKRSISERSKNERLEDPDSDELPPKKAETEDSVVPRKKPNVDEPGIPRKKSDLSRRSSLIKEHEAPSTPSKRLRKEDDRDRTNSDRRKSDKGARNSRILKQAKSPKPNTYSNDSTTSLSQSSNNNSKVISQLSKIFNGEVRSNDEKAEKDFNPLSGEEASKISAKLEAAVRGLGLNQRDYVDQIRSLLVNLKMNVNLRSQVSLGEISMERLVKMESHEMQTDKRKAEVKKLEQQNMHFSQKSVDQQVSEGLFKCAKCKGDKTSYYEMQTRSADEPMTAFVTCMTCNNKWKEG